MEVARKLQEGRVFFADTVKNPDRREFFVCQPDDFAPRTAQLTLKRDDARRWGMKVQFEKSF
jgi:hypothetical protein